MVWIGVQMVLCLSASGWQPVNGVPRLSLYGGWARLNTPPPPSEDKQKRMDGWLQDSFSCLFIFFFNYTHIFF